MEKDTLQKLVSKDLSQREIARELNISQTNIRHWLKKYELKTKLLQCNKTSDDDGKTKTCQSCKLKKKTNSFYKTHKNRTTVSNHCKDCSNKRIVERSVSIKLKMIAYKGGKCENCPITIEHTHYSVFDFHHLDPKTKDINFRSIKSRSWKYIQNELDKCKMLCANCHRIVHAKLHEKNKHGRLAQPG